MKNKDDKPKPSEGELKLAVSEYLEYKTNSGELYADRLNSGAIYEKRGDKTYGVMLCREGTADFFVFHKVNVGGAEFLKLIFLELKSATGKQRPEQEVFQKLVEAQGASYFLIRTVEEVMEILGEKVTN